ncbi:MAG: PqiC family protein [Planctomycetes bacterium]|nr:PqiC family protein [Planctomycetota bacterium]
MTGLRVFDQYENSIRLCLGLCLLSLLTSCAGTPVRRYYDLQPEPDFGEFEVQADLLGLVHLTAVQVPDFLNDPRLFYRSSRFEAGYYEYHRWVRPLSEALADTFLKSLRTSGCFHSVMGPSDGRTPWTLQVLVKVEAFNEVDRAENGEQVWTACAALRFFMTSSSGTEMDSFLIEETVEIPDRNAGGVVQGLNQALDRALPRAMKEILEFAGRTGRTGNNRATLPSE